MALPRHPLPRPGVSCTVPCSFLDALSWVPTTIKLLHSCHLPGPYYEPGPVLSALVQCLISAVIILPILQMGSLRQGKGSLPVGTH